MDCEKFDQHVIDALYDELDELTHAALRRHLEGCSRCAGVWAGLRATREVGILPLEEPPDDLEARILDAVAVAQQRAPWHKKVLRGLAWAGSHAMRPQLAMAALFFLVIGSSLLLLRARPGTLGPVSVTERGSPSPDTDNAAAARAAAAPPPAAASAVTALAEGDGKLDQGAIGGDVLRGPMPKSVDATNEKNRGSADAARAALAEAREVRDKSGCAAAVPKLDAVAATFAGTQSAADAMWDEASCYKQMGEAQKAQQLYLALRGTGYRDRAEREINAAEGNVALQNNNQMASRAPAAAPTAPPTASAAPTAVAGGVPPSAVAAAPAPAPPPPAKVDEANVDARPGGGAAGGKASPKRPAMGAPNPRAPAAPQRPAYDHADAYSNSL